MFGLTASPRRQLVLDTAADTQNAFVNIAGNHRSKNMANPWWCVHFHFCHPPPPKGVEHLLCPSAGRAQGLLRASYLVQSLSYRCTAGRSKWQRHRTFESDGSRPQTWWIIVFTGNLAPRCASCRTVAQCHQPPPLPFITYQGPSQCPWVDKPHPASVAGTRPAVTGCARKDVAQVVRKGSCVSNRHNSKFSQNALNGDDVENRFPVIKLVYNSRAHRFQPT